MDYRTYDRNRAVVEYDVELGLAHPDNDDAREIFDVIVATCGRPTAVALGAVAGSLHTLTDYGFWLLSPVMAEAIEKKLAEGSLLVDTAFEIMSWGYFDEANQRLQRRAAMHSDKDRADISRILAKRFQEVDQDEPYHFVAETLAVWAKATP